MCLRIMCRLCNEGGRKLAGWRDVDRSGMGWLGEQSEAVDTWLESVKVWRSG